jgi:hypothetical protein
MKRIGETPPRVVEATPRHAGEVSACHGLEIGRLLLCLDDSRFGRVVDPEIAFHLGADVSFRPRWRRLAGNIRIRRFNGLLQLSIDRVAV